MAKDHDLKTPLLQEKPDHDHDKDEHHVVDIPPGAGSSQDPTAAAKADQLNVAAATVGSSQDPTAAAKADQQLNAAAAESSAEAEARAKAKAEKVKEEVKAKTAEDVRAQVEQDAKAQAERDAKAQADKEAQEAADLEKARVDRMTQLSQGLQRVYSRDFYKRISPDHQKVMKELIDERSKLDEKAIALQDKCQGLSTPLFNYIAGTVTLYGVVNVAMVVTDVIGVWRTLTLIPFIYLLNYYKESALTQLRTMKEVESVLIEDKRLELIRKMNQLRCLIDVSAPKEKADDHEMKIPPEGSIPDHVKSAQKITDEAAGDNFQIDCQKILAPRIPETYFEATKDKINATFLCGIVVLVILGLCFLAHALAYYWFPRSGPASPPTLPPHL